MKINDHLYAFLWDNPGENNCNTYLFLGGKRILVDPGHDGLFDRIEEGLSKLALTLEDLDMVFVTHGHPDHLEGIQRFFGKDVIIAMGEREWQFLIQRDPYFGDLFKPPEAESLLFLKEGTLEVGDIAFEVLHTPGHSPGSMCLYFPALKALITGDVVFDRGLGRTDLPGGRGEHLKESIRRLSRLDVDLLLPGHGNFIAGRENVRANFEEIERVWFAYL
jgi:glyoxylase-like metal-dependent hydrolase (beta-lactamase superfamily II)